MKQRRWSRRRKKKLQIMTMPLKVMVCAVSKFISVYEANSSKHMISQQQQQQQKWNKTNADFYKSRAHFEFVSSDLWTAQPVSLADKTNNINLFIFMANHKSLEIFSILCFIRWANPNERKTAVDRSESIRIAHTRSCKKCKAYAS